MEDKEFAQYFKQDYCYYDMEKKELNKIISLINFKPNQILIDIGAGIGRLSVPLSKYVKVTSIEPNKVLLNEIKKENILKVNLKIENFFPKEKFDFALIGWPQFKEYHIIFKHIKDNILKENGQLIVIKSKQHSLREITKKLFPNLFGEGKNFLNILPKYFEIKKEELIETKHTYPNIEKAFKLMTFEIEGFYEKKINKEQERILFEFVKEHEDSGKILMNAQLRILLCNPK